MNAVEEACKELSIDPATASKNEIFEAVVHYDGLLGSYPEIIKDWVESIYHIRLSKVDLLAEVRAVACYLKAQGLGKEINLQLAYIIDAIDFITGEQE